ncbi:IS3 family transposase [Candidatus Enterococcus moelleringii]|uniref:IS3 family transposase n=1 Tax=Candidatus Enterococcus moelleringii TaxID=2815325 RepID=UPI001F6085D1|nr:IS3 family transposase [Enterococcus sp. 669A]
MLNISWLCEATQVSRSGYYAWLNRKDQRNQKEAQDQADYALILEVYHFRGYAKGSRSIHMRLMHTGIIMNRKKIQRLMRKYQLVCPIRKPNPYKRMAKAKKEHATKPNLVDRQFDVTTPKTVLLTDITYLRYGRGKFAYLSTIKDSCTHQILAYVLSESLMVDFVLETVEQLLTNHVIPKNQKTLIHSDQGVHYTSIKFQSLLKDKKLRQSMSRRGNCWDNAPQESFFGHMKDELPDLGSCDRFAELHALIDTYMHYYNEERYQWKLEKLSPNQYERYLKTGDHPLANRLEA